jgi:hypothetical protein
MPLSEAVRRHGRVHSVNRAGKNGRGGKICACAGSGGDSLGWLCELGSRYAARCRSVGEDDHRAPKPAGACRRWRG